MPIIDVSTLKQLPNKYETFSGMSTEQEIVKRFFEKHGYYPERIYRFISPAGNWQFIAIEVK